MILKMDVRVAAENTSEDSRSNLANPRTVIAVEDRMENRSENNCMEPDMAAFVHLASAKPASSLRRFLAG